MSEITNSENPLSDRIAIALRGQATSDDVADLIGEVERARAVVTAGFAAARARALDPTAGSEKALSSKREEESLRFELARLDTALQALETVKTAALAREGNARRRAAYDAALSMRDNLVIELRETYPEIERELSDLISRLSANDQDLMCVNSNLPVGVRPIESADEVARGGREKFMSYNDRNLQRLTLQLRLPRFEVDPRNPYAWPRRE